MDTAESFLDAHCYEYPEDGIGWFEEDKDLYLRHYWGFTIYRTFYGRGSEEQWCRLLQTIYDVTKVQVSRTNADDEDNIAKMWEWFRLDARSDSATMDGLTLENARELWLKENGTKDHPRRSRRDPWRVFLIADVDVLADPYVRIVKAAAADYDHSAHKGYTWRLGPRRYFGWFTIDSGSILGLWVALENYFFEDLGNHVSGPREVWDGDYFLHP